MTKKYFRLFLADYVCMQFGRVSDGKLNHTENERKKKIIVVCFFQMFLHAISNIHYVLFKHLVLLSRRLMEN